MPKTKRDAAVVYGEGGGKEVRGKRVEIVNVLEVLADRFGDRVGRWGGFGVGEGGVEVRNVF